MKVLMINGSRKDDGCTWTALNEVGKSLLENGVEYEIFNVGKRVFNGEIAETVKEASEKIKSADALIVGSPVYYASPSGEIVSFLDRFFAVSAADMRFKPAAAVSTCRRAGNSSTLDVLAKYFFFNSMPVISSCYWNEVHGKTADDVLKDEEGCQIMRCLGKNMAWVLKSIEAGKAAGVRLPEIGERIYTNFI